MPIHPAGTLATDSYFKLLNPSYPYVTARVPAMRCTLLALAQLALQTGRAPALRL